MPINVQHAELADHLMPLQDLDWHDSRVLELVVRDPAVEDLETAVVAGVGKEGKSAPVEPHLTDRLAVKPHCLVWPVGQVEVVPQETLVVAADDQVVTAGVDVKGRDPETGQSGTYGLGPGWLVGNVPFRAGLDNLDQLKFLEVIAANRPLGSHKEQRPEGVEGGRLCEARKLAERDLRQVLRQRVDGYGTALSRG